jgi:molybdate transport system substrate-binding protein
MNHHWAIGAMLLCLTLGCRSQSQPVVAIFAATSTGDVLEEITRDFEAETGVRVTVNPAASSTLAIQIEQGAGADLFLSADEAWADRLERKTLCAERRDLLGNRLVVVVPADNAMSLGGLDDVTAEKYKRIAVAREGVPAGDYTRQALRAAGVWDTIKGRTVEGGDVRATLTYVLRGEADAGFVYATDAAAHGKVRIAYEVPEQLHQPIRYPLVLIRRDLPNPAAKHLYDYLASDKASAAFRRAGFQTLP